MFESVGTAEVARVMVHAAGETLTGLAHLDPTAMDDATVRATARELESVRRRLDAASCHFLAELHGRGSAEDAEGLSTSRWLAREAGMSAGGAKQRVQTATKLRDVLPAVDSALREGRIGFDHARVLADVTNDRNAAAMAAASADLCALASCTAFARWRRDVHALASLADPDGGHDPDDLTRNQLHLSSTDGLAMFRGELTGDHALAFEHAVDAKADELFRQYTAERELFTDQQIPPRATLRALALVELCRQAHGVDLGSTRGPRTDTTVVLHADRAPGDPSTPAELRLHGPSRAAGEPLGAARPVVTTPGGARVDAGVASMLMCSTVFRGLWADAEGVPIAETDARRPTRSQRRALQHRDGGCVFPGCGASFEWTDAHHLRPWPAGPTALWNLVSLCRRHHRAAHGHRWTLDLTDGGWTRWTSPGGHTRWGQRHGSIRAGP